jgi:hypothetical protein
LLSSPRNGRQSVEAIADAKGEYRFSRLREGAYVVQCSANDFTSAGMNQEFTSVFSSRESRLDFRMKAGLQIRGIIVNKENRPIPNVSVAYLRGDAFGGRGGRGGGRGNFPAQPGSSGFGSAVSDSRGMFQISGLMDSSYSISIIKRDYLNFTTIMQPSNQLQTITLDSGLSVRGAVRDIKGSAIKQFSLSLQSVNKKSNENSYDIVSTDGYFEIRGLLRDKYTVTLWDEDYGKDKYSGTIDLQDSMQIFLITGEEPYPAANSLTISARSR